MTAAEERLKRSVRRLMCLLTHPNVPNPVLDGEFKIAAQTIAMIVGPDRVRQWADQVTENVLSTLDQSQP